MEITTTPVCKVGWEGQTLTYAVKATGATEILVPENDTKGIAIRVLDTQQVPGGVEAQLEVKVLDSTLF